MNSRHTINFYRVIKIFFAGIVSASCISCAHVSKSEKAADTQVIPAFKPVADSKGPVAPRPATPLPVMEDSPSKAEAVTSFVAQEKPGGPQADLQAMGKELPEFTPVASETGPVKSTE